MAYTNSKLVNYTRISPNRSVNRNHKIDTVSIHCVVGQCSVETLGSIFASTSKEASSNYGIGYDGRIGMYVEEKDRSWCTSSASNDNRAITIEVASDTYHPYRVNDAAYKSLIKLLVDICKRNGIKKLVWSTDKSERMNHLNGCNMTVHRDYANKSCPGDYLYNLHGQIAKEVNAQLGSGTSSTATTAKKTLYRVRKTWKDVKSQKGAFYDLSNAKKCADKNNGYFVFDESGKAVYTSKATNSTSSFKVQISISDLNIRKGPGTNYATTGKFTGKGVFTIVETKQGSGSAKGWGKLKSGAGWIALDYATRI
ncbi:MAG: N-acetylmuramoyl-L-alanine amidase [Acutalibacteraceae bacterium]|nr:N-acetylmuramoyl-L-alanine amidase [Acutalibacteraceae bacterium]